MSSHDETRSIGRAALRLARAYRKAREADLSEEVRQGLWNTLYAELEPTMPMQQASPSLQREGAVPSATSPAQVERSAETADLQDEFSKDVQQRIAQIEMRLRHLTEQEAQWSKIEPLALELYRLRPTPQTAARLIELGYLQSGLSTLEALMRRFWTEQPMFWRFVHKAVRENLTISLWKSGASDVLAALLYRNKDETYLQPIERLCVFWSLRGARDKSAALVYYRKYKQALAQAAETLGPKVGLYPSVFFLEAGRLAVDLGDADEARECLELVNPNDPERDEALRLLLDVAVDRNRAGRSHYMEMIYSAQTDSERISLLEKFFQSTRGLSGFRDRNRPALNELLVDPLSWVQEDPEIWRTLSMTLFRAKDLESLVPNLFEVFRKNADRFYAPLLDTALWQGPLLSQGDDPRDLYWRGVALLHHYVNCGASQEESLWEARELIAQAKRRSDRPLPAEWRELHKAAFSWVAKNHYLIEPDRERMLRQMRVAVETVNCVAQDIQDYLESGDKAPLSVLAALQKTVRDKQDPGLEQRLILKRAAHAHLTNFDLNRLWQLANNRKDNDLAWRVATVLHARMALIPQVRAAWEISGEKRTQYPFLKPGKDIAPLLLAGLEPKMARLCFASQQAGWALPELLYLLDDGAQIVRGPTAASDSMESRVDEALNQITWLGAPKKKYRFSFEAAPLGHAMPQFAQILPSNPWSVIVARLADRLGVNAWGWKLSRLHQQIEGLIPRIASRQDLRRRSGKVADWLKSLTPGQRSAWQDMALLSRALEDDRAAFAMAAFICRLASVIYGNHIMALQSLQTMRAPVEVIWDLERFLLSDSFSEIRKKLGVNHRILVPNALQRLATVVVTTGAAD